MPETRLGIDMGNFVALIVFGCFSVLCSFAYGKITPNAHYAKPVVLIRDIGTTWNSKKAAMLADVYGLTPADVARKVNIYGE